MIMATGQIGAEEGSEKMASLLALSWLEPRKVVAATREGSCTVSNFNRVHTRKLKTHLAILWQAVGGPRAWSALSVITGSWPGHHLSLFCIACPLPSYSI